MDTTSNNTIVTNQRRAEIKNTVLDLLFNCNVNELPVDLKSILKINNIGLLNSDQAQQYHLIENVYFNFNGKTIFINGDPIIIYNAKHPKTRQRWTIAHELGHIFLDHTEWNKTTEAEANYFAKNLLEPIAVLADMGAVTVDSIAKCCGVSKHAAELRIKDLKRHINYKSKHGLTAHDIRFLRNFGRTEFADELCPAI